MPLNCKLRGAISYKITGAPDLGSAAAEFAGFKDKELGSGIGDNQADRLFSDRRTLAASANEDLDLSGVLLDPIGGAGAFSKVKAISIFAADSNINSVVVGGQAVNGFLGPFGALAHTIAIPPGGALMISAPKAGWPVTPATADLLRIANGGAGTSVTYDVVICGTSA